MEDTTTTPYPQFQALERRETDGKIPALFRIPPEIFSKIFLEVSSLFWDEEGPKTWQYHPVPWLEVTHICHRWRQIAVNDPNLWCRVKVLLVDDHPYVANFADQEHKTWIIEEVFRRSKELPLTVEVHGLPAARSTFPERDILKPILENIHRVKELTFPYSHAFRALYADFFESHFAGLEHLMIGFVEPIYEHISPVFASDQLPLLRTVDVRGLPITSLSGLFRPSVRRFALIHFEFTHDPLLYATLREYLENTASLEDLNLSMTTFDPPTPDIQPVPVTTRVELPNLQCLWFSCNMPSALEFFDHVTFPSQTMLDLRLIHVRPVALDLEDAKTFVSRISQHLVRDTKNPLTTIELYPIQGDEAE